MDTTLKDRLGKPIMVGNVVHWTDGGDDLSLEQRIRTRWDRIAVVTYDVARGVGFKVIDSPSEYTRKEGHTFRFSNFIYTDTERHLTVVADSQSEYESKFKSAGECMKWVLDNVGKADTMKGYTKLNDGLYIKVGE
jgi:hypothetical protein